MGRRLGIALLGAATLLIAAALFLTGGGSQNAGEIEQVEAALRPTMTVDSPPPTSDSPTTVPPTTTPPSGPEPELQPTTTTPPLPNPVGLRIDALGVDAPIGQYGVDERTGQMAVPDNVTEIGWYRFGAKPGDPGSAVLAAHVDLAGSGPGVFFELGSLDVDERVFVAYEDGTERAFRVVARATYDKEELPLDVIFSREGPPVLTLITCGGGFNRSVARYDSNIVVYAVPDSGNELAEGSTL